MSAGLDERAWAERRRSPRFRPEELQEAVFVVGAIVVDIGAHGLMLEAPVPLPADSPLRFHLVVGGEKTVVDARVRRCVPRERAGGWGVGVEFEPRDDDALRRLEGALASTRRGTA